MRRLGVLACGGAEPSLPWQPRRIIELFARVDLHRVKDEGTVRVYETLIFVVHCLGDPGDGFRVPPAVTRPQCRAELAPRAAHWYPRGVGGIF